MSELRNRIEQEVDKLKARRDELRVQVDLGKKDAEDAWNKADEKWSELEAHLLRLKREGEEVADDIGAAADKLIAEVKDGFRDLLKLV